MWEWLIALILAITGGATATEQAEPLNPLRMNPTPGECSEWREVFAAFDATDDELTFFFDGGILWRETRCGLDTLNESTGDSGICPINPVHNRPGYFGGQEFGSGGWLMALHGLTTRQNVDSVAWAEPCLTLHRVCGRLPWVRPYGCENRALP